MPIITALDIAKRNGYDETVGLIDEAKYLAPEVTGRTRYLGNDIQVPGVGASRTIEGTTFTTLVRTSLPTVDGFRRYNEGVGLSKGTTEKRIVQCYPYQLRVEVDKQLAQTAEGGAAVLMADEAQAQVNATLKFLSRTFYDGRDVTDLSHPGIRAALDATMVIDAGGTTASTGSEVWVVKFGTQGVQWIYGNNGSMQFGELFEETLRDANNLPYAGYSRTMMMHVGLQVASKYSVARIKNLTADSGKTLDDTKLIALLNLFPVGEMPDAIFMSRRSYGQLQASRTVTNATGEPAPFPRDVQGVPIIPTDAISNTMAIE